MRRWASHLLSMIAVLLVLVLLDFGLFAGISFGTNGNRYFVPIGRISDSIRKEGNGYVVEETQQKQLDKLNAFLLLIGNDGRIAWQYHQPEDIPESFCLSDVASFTRWYLQDYPVHTWVREDGILVIGFPKNSMWKYVVEFRMETIETVITLLPYIVAANVLILLLLPVWLTKRRIRIRDRLRTEWIAGVSHDIRTPLSIVMGNAEKGGIIEKQCFRIRDLVNNLNTENKLENGIGKWSKEKIRLAVLVRGMVCDYINLEDERYSFCLDIDPELENCVLKADESLIRRMIDNLISNAICHNEAGCEIMISLQKIPWNRMMLRIEDNGVGVAEEQLKKLNARLNHDYLPEHGLGIRVVKQIAKRYRYKTVFRSEAGSYFSCNILFPLFFKCS